MWKEFLCKIKRVTALKRKISAISRNLDEIKMMQGRLWSANLKTADIRCLQEAEFKVYSQWGDDGIIQYLLSILEIKNKVFIEFGVEDYEEANTRFLLKNNNWRGLIIDGVKENISKIVARDEFWRYDLTAKAAFVTRENINALILDSGFSGDIGLLHIDIDGNDYWVWKAIDVVAPVIVIIEYNSVFGSEKLVTVPYDPAFLRSKAHHSFLFWGASLPALCDLAQEKGYVFIGSNSNGNNAYFIRKDCFRDSALKALTAQEGYVCSCFRESRNERGDLNYLAGDARLKAVRGCLVFNIKTSTLEVL